MLLWSDVEGGAKLLLQKITHASSSVHSNTIPTSIARNTLHAWRENFQAILFLLTFSCSTYLLVFFFSEHITVGRAVAKVVEAVAKLVVVV